MITIALAAGGTGGHLFPAQSLAQELTQRGYKVILFTDKRGEALAQKFPNIDLYILRAASPSKKHPVLFAQAMRELTAGYWQARKILKDHDVKAFVGFGGYASAPAIFAARKQKIPFILHEQNAVLGRANRALARNAARIALSFEQTKFTPMRRAILTGNPIREDIRNLSNNPYPDLQGKIRILIVGGSLGATIFSTVIPEALALLAPGLRARLEITQQCRADHLDDTRAAYEKISLQPTLAPFFEDLPQRLGAAHLVISRAGGSVAELAAMGRPSILVPLPSAADDHQTANASALEQAGAAWLIPQPEFTPETLAKLLENLLNQPFELTKAAERAKSIARPDAAEKLADEVLKIIRE